MGSFEVKMNYQQINSDLRLWCWNDGLWFRFEMKKKLEEEDEEEDDEDEEKRKLSKRTQNFSRFSKRTQFWRGKIVHLVKVKGWLTLTNSPLTVVSNLQKKGKLL